MSETEFVSGLIVKAKNEKAPAFVKCHLSIKRAELIDWLQARDGDWVNVDIKESRGGKLYAAVNNFKPKREERKATGGGALDSDIPFSPERGA